MSPPALFSAFESISGLFLDGPTARNCLSCFAILRSLLLIFCRSLQGIQIRRLNNFLTLVFLIGAAAVANNWRHRIGTGKKFLRAETFGIEIGIGERLSGTKPSFCVNLVLGKRGKPKKGFFSSTDCVDMI